MSFAQMNAMGGLSAAPQRPSNPFADNEDYIALQEYQKSLGPTEEELSRLRELQTAFTSSDAYQTHRQEELQRQQMMAAQRQQMGGIMGMAPMGMRQRMPMMQHPMRVGGYGAPQMQMGNNTMQMLMAILAQAFGGGMRQQPQYGPPSQQGQLQFGVMPSSGGVTRQEMGGTSLLNQLGAMPQVQNRQQQVYAQQQQASPFGGASRGYYA